MKMSTNTDAKNEAILIFEEDEVSRQGGEGKEFGLVIETSEYMSSDEEDYEEDEERVKKGTVRVAWFPEGQEEVVEEDILTLEDRSLMPGDVVRRFISGTNSQRGFVKDMRVLCDLRIVGTDTIMRGIDARELLKTEEWDGESNLISLDSWVGRVEAVTVDIVVRFPDNSRMELTQVDMFEDGFNDVTDSKREEDSEFRIKVFYEGQILEESYRSILDREHEWLTESKTYGRHHSKHCTKKVRLVVEEVNTRELDVHWMCRGYAETEAPTAKLQMPPRVIEESMLPKVRRLDHFEHCSIQIGDRAYSPLQKSELLKHRLAVKGQIQNGTNKENDKTNSQENETTERSTQTGHENGIDCCSNSECSGDTETHKKSGNAENTETHETMETTENTDTHKTTETTENTDTHKTMENAVKTDTHKRTEKAENTDKPAASGDAPGMVVNGEVDGEDADGEYESGSDCEEDHGGDGNEKSSRKRTNSGCKHRNRASRAQRKQQKANVHRARKNKENEKLAVEVIHTVSFVDVMWQDSTVELSIPSYDLYPIHHLDELEFFPGDFVMRADEDVPSSDYGVVSKVDHQARTCMVKWVTPYEIGVSDKPTESEPMEMSVYDIKDHSDYKFRPDQVVVRVCGYENTPGCSEAAGQIVDIEPSGELVVCWADGVRSKAYPQEVFLISDETSDYGSSEWGSDEDDSVCSWETEEEQTETESENDEDKEVPEEVKEKKKKKEKEEEAKAPSDDALSLGPGDKLELDYHLDRLETALERPMQPDVIDRVVDCYRNVLTVHKQCLDLDRLLGSNHFEDKELMSIIGQVRRELRREKQNKMQTHLLQQAQSYVAARKCHENGRSSPPVVDREACEGSDSAVPKSKSEPSSLASKQQQIQILKQSPDGLETVDDIESELCASLEKAKTVCASALRALRKQIGKVRDQLGAMWQKKLDQVNQNKEEEEESTPGVPELMSPLSPDQSRFMPIFEERFVMTDVVPSQHNFYSREHTPQDAKAFLTAVRKEMKLLRNNLPAGIRVVGFEERMDLYTVLVVGPSCTPYEDGLFFFDVQLPNSYPAVPPSFHYISFCTDRLNPNLYNDGNVCVSLLGTWGGKGTELWSSSSNMLQVLVSIQGLILNSEPYYNEAGYEKQRATQMGMENSKVYNEMAILKLVQSMMKIVKNPPTVFKDDVIQHMKANAPRMIKRLESWIHQTETYAAATEPSSQCETTPSRAESGGPGTDQGPLPDFPLIPASRGFCLTLKSHLNELGAVLKEKDMI